MRLWPLITDLIARLIARLIAVNGKIAITSHRTAPARHVRPRMRMRTRTARPAGRPRRAAPRLGLGLGLGHGHGQRLSRAGSQGEQGFGGLLTLILCAQKLALGNSVVATGEGEERSRVASVLWCRMDEGNGTSYIVTQVLRIVEPGHHQSHLGDAV